MVFILFTAQNINYIFSYCLLGLEVGSHVVKSRKSSITKWRQVILITQELMIKGLIYAGRVESNFTYFM